MFGQLLGYAIYIRNLMLTKVWQDFHRVIKLFLAVLPVLALIAVFSGPKHNINEFVEYNSNIYLMIWGMMGQVVFTSRFVYQWLYSEKKKESVFPAGFWLLSITGATLISSYAFYLHLYPIIIGHAIGMLVYIRNLMIHFNFLTKKSNKVIKSEPK